MADILTDNQVEEIRATLAYNYKIIDRVLICLSVKPKILEQPENEYVGVIIDEASKNKLVDRIYQKNATGEFLDTWNTTGDVPTELLLEKLVDLFRLPVDVLAGKRKLNLGIKVPNEISSGDDTLSQDIIDFDKRHPEWKIELFATDMKEESNIRMAVQFILNNKKLYMSNQDLEASATDDLQYNPLNIDGIRAFIFVIDNKMFHLPTEMNEIFRYIKPEGVQVLIDEFIQEKWGRNSKQVSENTIQELNSRVRNKKNNTLIDEYEQYVLSVFKQLFVYHLFIQIAESTSNADNFIYSPTYKFNVYCLDSIIHYIAESTFDYLYGSKDKGLSIWKFLRQIDTQEKLQARISEPFEDDGAYDLTGIDDYLDIAEDAMEESQFYQRLSLSVPAPLKLNTGSELLRLILAIESIGYVFTTTAENREHVFATSKKNGEISSGKTTRRLTPKFDNKSILY